MDHTRQITIATRLSTKPGKHFHVDLVNGLNATVHDGTYRVLPVCKTWASLNTLVFGVVLGGRLVSGADVVYYYCRHYCLSCRASTSPFLIALTNPAI